MKYLLFIIACLGFSGCSSQSSNFPSNKDSNSLLWEISGKGIQPAYMYGTFHLLCRDDIHISDNTRRAIREAEEVYFELDLDDPATALGMLFFMNMRNDTTLQDLLTGTQYQKVQSFFRDSIHLSIGNLQKMKPLLLQAMLYTKMLPCTVTGGVDESLARVAKEYNKNILGLETLAFQAAIFDSIPYTIQAKELVEGIDSLQVNKKNLDSLIQVYKSQELQSIEKLNPRDMKGMDSEILLDNRNRNWVIMLKELMKKKQLFVAVGAGHLVGKNGLIELLKKEGYKLRPIINE